MNDMPLGSSWKDISPKEVDCPTCGGSGLCADCLGDGKQGFCDKTPCNRCRGNGDCRKCSGTGNVLKSEIED